ncbi:hypothetical protein, partial [Nonomuraea sp. 10N515B]|uniref:hypothetical protein n=1 Tax=Nonomuraea sp. 10N515B TaxID=3457422 RepID=UPI003FCE8D99
STPSTPSSDACEFCRIHHSAPPAPSITRRIAELAAEARTLSTDRSARTPERKAAYFWTKAAVLAEIAATWGDADHLAAVEARHVAAQARRRALDITDELAAAFIPATHPF